MPSLSLPLIVALLAIFTLVAVVAGSVASTVLQRHAPERRRLRTLTAAFDAQDALVREDKPLVVNADADVRYIKRYVPKSPAEVGRVRRRLMRAGYLKAPATIIYIWSELLLPVVLGLTTIAIAGTSINALLLAGFLAILGYITPGFVLSHLISRRKLALQNGLADALDLLIVCVESGSSLDQGLLKTSQELAVSYPELATELGTVNLEIRAGKSRIEAFRNLASRTGLEDVRTLVAMLVQTDRFGTSVAQALRTLAVTLRKKRRQNAEERAAKIGVKLVFPLVFCLFPAFYVVTLGPAIIQFVRVFFGQVVN